MKIIVLFFLILNIDAAESSELVPALSGNIGNLPLRAVVLRSIEERFPSCAIPEKRVDIKSESSMIANLNFITWSSIISYIHRVQNAFERTPLADRDLFLGFYEQELKNLFARINNARYTPLFSTRIAASFFIDQQRLDHAIAKRYNIAVKSFAYTIKNTK
jgi:hypothetical protein